MERFKALDFQPHQIGNGVRAVMKFPNGYEASVINVLDGSYGANDGLYEIAVMYDMEIVYNTPVTDYVLGFLSESDVDEVLGRIFDLPAKDAAA